MHKIFFILLIKSLIILMISLGLGSTAYANLPDFDHNPARDEVGFRDAAQDALNAFDAGQTQQRVSTGSRSYFNIGAGIQPDTNKPLPPSIAIAGGDKIHFKLEKVVFIGNTVFSSQELAQIFDGSLGKTISLNQLQILVDEVTKKYHLSGYILSQANLPPQTINKGSVLIEVIEGYISRTNITGHTGNARWFLQKYANAILKSRPLNEHALEYNLLLANDLPGISVKGVITPSPTIPDSADLTLVTDHKIVNAYVAYDNYGTRYLGPQEISYGVTFNSGYFPGDSNEFNFMTTSRHKEVHYMEYAHTQPLGTRGLKLVLGTNYTETRPGFVLNDVDVVSRSASIYGNLTYPIIRSRVQTLNVGMQANYQNVTSTILTFPFYQDRFRTLSIGGDYSTVDRWQGIDVLTLSLMEGFSIWGAAPHFYQSRPNGQSRFTLATFNLSRLQPFFSRFSFYFASQGQYSCNVLLATEQFGFGGPIYGRGYDPYEISGDRGIAAKMELRTQFLPELRFFNAWQFYLFYDAGMVWNIDNFDLPGRQDGTSTGAGIRVHFMNNLDAETYIAKPLTIPVAALLAIPANGNQARVYFQLIARI